MIVCGCGRVAGEATSDSGRSDTRGHFALVTRLDEDFAAARFLGGITYKGKLEIIRPHVKQETGIFSLLCYTKLTDVSPNIDRWIV